MKNFFKTLTIATSTALLTAFKTISPDIAAAEWSVPFDYEKCYGADGKGDKACYLEQRDALDATLQEVKDELAAFKKSDTANQDTLQNIKYTLVEGFSHLQSMRTYNDGLFNRAFLTDQMVKTVPETYQRAGNLAELAATYFAARDPELNHASVHDFSQAFEIFRVAAGFTGAKILSEETSKLIAEGKSSNAAKLGRTLLDDFHLQAAQEILRELRRPTEDGKPVDSFIAYKNTQIMQGTAEAKATVFKAYVNSGTAVGIYPTSGTALRSVACDIK